MRRSLSSMICVRCQILEMFQEAGDPVGKPTKAPGTIKICCSEGVKRFWTCGTLSCDSTGSPQLSVVLMVSDYRITVISGDNLIAGALPVQPEATPLAATKTTVQMHGEQTDRLNPRLWGVMSSRCRVLNVQPEPETRRARPQLWVGCQVKAVWRRVVTGNTSCLSELDEIQETRQVNEQIPPRPSHADDSLWNNYFC